MHVACVLLFGAVVAVITGADLIIRPAGESFTKAVGGSIVMTCTIPVINRTVGSMSVGWLDKNGIEVSSRVGRMYVESESAVTKKLYITGIQNSDAGLYTCRASTGVELLQKSIELQLFKEITFEDTPLAQSVAMHSDAIIVCRATGNPLPDVSWRFRGHRILEGERYVQVVGGLKILGVTRSDDGEYTCRAEVEVDGRYDERRIIVSVHITPKMKMEVGDSEGVQGTDFYLSCAADGFPAPTYKFYKDGSLLVSSNRIQVNEVVGNVYFSPLHKDDEGSYNCSASNDVGTATSTGSLLVLVPPSIFGVVDAETIEGQSATLSCQSQGDPVPEISFHKDGQQSAYQLGLNVGGAMVSSPKIGHLQLTFENVTPSDSANYTCRSRNSVGMDERLVTLLVQFKPRFHVNHSVQAFVWAGRPRNVTCRVNSHPASVIEWFRNGKRIEQNETFRVHQADHLFESTSFLQIRIREADQVWIYGSFECRAKNFLGTASINIELKRASAPDAPKSVSVVNRLPTELVLFAAPPDEDGGMPVTGYRVEFEDQVQDFKLDEVPLKITGLRPSTKYMLRVRAVSEVGAGNPVLETVITENIRRPYPIVINSEPQGTEPYEYTVTWNLPATGGLAITLYEFQYRRVKVEDGTFNFTEPLEDWTSYSVHDNPDRPMLYHKVIDLEPDSHYELVVEARNSLGKSDPSARFIFLTASGGDALPAHKRSSLDWNVVIGVVVVMLIVFLIIIDFSCYFMNSCGVTMFLCVHVCGRQHRRSGQRGIEEGESEKKPLSDDVPPDVETMATYQSRPMRLPPLPTEDEEDRDGVYSHSGSERTESHRRVPSVLTDHELR